LILGIVMDEHSEHMPNFQLHLVGMWVTFVVSAALITTFVSRMAAAIRSRELTLAKARENELRNEQLVAIGSLAAALPTHWAPHCQPWRCCCRIRMH